MAGWFQRTLNTRRPSALTRGLATKSRMMQHAVPLPGGPGPSSTTVFDGSAYVGGLHLHRQQLATPGSGCQVGVAAIRWRDGDQQQSVNASTCCGCACQRTRHGAARAGHTQYSLHAAAHQLRRRRGRATVGIQPTSALRPRVRAVALPPVQAAVHHPGTWRTRPAAGGAAATVATTCRRCGRHDAHQADNAFEMAGRHANRLRHGDQCPI